MYFANLAFYQHSYPGYFGYLSYPGYPDYPSYLWIASSSLTAGRVFSCYGPLARPSLQIASVVLEHQPGKNNESSNQGQHHFMVFSKIHLSLLDKSSRQVTCKQMA